MHLADERAAEFEQQGDGRVQFGDGEAHLEVRLGVFAVYADTQGRGVHLGTTGLIDRLPAQQSGVEGQGRRDIGHTQFEVGRLTGHAGSLSRSNNPTFDLNISLVGPL